MSEAAQQRYWDTLYAKPIPDQHRQMTLGWLETMLAAANVALRGTILELGCGRGNETRQLVGAERSVFSLDLSLNGLRQATLTAPQAHLVQANLAEPLPFRAGAFDLAIAGLSLHYFSHERTHAIVAEIARVLKPRKALVFQVNAAGDRSSGYGVGTEIEPGVFVNNERQKRFFTEQDCVELFAHKWRLVALQHGAEGKYGTEKQAWTGMAVLDR